MKETTLCFIREDQQIDTLVLARFVGPFGDVEDVLSRLRRAITKWINETPEGRKLWQYSCQDLNIGDVADYLFDPGSSLAPYLRGQGVEQAIHLHTLTEGERVGFDAVLVDRANLACAVED